MEQLNSPEGSKELEARFLEMVERTRKQDEENMRYHETMTRSADSTGPKMELLDHPCHCSDRTAAA